MIIEKDAHRRILFGVLVINNSLNRFYNISEAIILIRHLILVAGPCSPTVHTAKAELAGLNLEDRKITGGEVATVILMGLLNRAAIQIIHKIRKGTTLHCACGLEG